MENIERITEGDRVYGIVLRSGYNKPGANFFTPEEFSQQLGMLVHEKGTIVQRHRHKLVKREIFRTQEVLVLLKGKLKVDLYDDNVKLLKSVILTPGDSILLAQGGHRVEILEAAKIIEVKQGPYSGFDEKEFF
jgi:cupin fold WbuC family metalloprotein